MDSFLSPQERFDLLQSLLESILDDTELLRELVHLARDGWLGSYWYLWAPKVYLRDRDRFRPLILAQMEHRVRDRQGRWFDPWLTSFASALNSWFESADKASDVEVVQRLNAWRFSSLPPERRSDSWRIALLEQLELAKSVEERALVLEKMSSNLVLDEPTAVRVLELAPDVSHSFLRRHLPKKEPPSGLFWSSLASAVRQRGDYDLFFAIYRSTVEDAQWERDLQGLIERMDGTVDIEEEILRRHPLRPRANAPSVVLLLLRAKAKGAESYVRRLISDCKRHVRNSAASWEAVLRFSDEHGFCSLWVQLVEELGQPVFDSEVRRLAEFRVRTEAETLASLWALAGLGRHRCATGGTKSFFALSDDTARMLYGRYPALLRSVYRQHVVVTAERGYPGLLGDARAQSDSTIAYHILAQLLNYRLGRTSELKDWRNSLLPFIGARDTDLLEGSSLDPVALASVLSLLPPDNPAKLACKIPRVLELSLGIDPLAFLDLAPVVVSLLLARSHVARRIGLRVLDVDDSRAMAIASDNVPTLRSVALSASSTAELAAVCRILGRLASNPSVVHAVVDLLRVLIVARPAECEVRVICETLGKVLSENPQWAEPSEQVHVFQRNSTCS